MIHYQYSTDGTGRLILTLHGEEIGTVYNKEHAEMIEQKFAVDVDSLEKQIEYLNEKISDLEEKIKEEMDDLIDQRNAVMEKLFAIAELLKH